MRLQSPFTEGSYATYNLNIHITAWKARQQMMSSTARDINASFLHLLFLYISPMKVFGWSPTYKISWKSLKKVFSPVFHFLLTRSYLWCQRGLIHSSWRAKLKVSESQSRLTFADPMDYNLPGSSVHSISKQEHWSG